MMILEHVISCMFVSWTCAAPHNILIPMWRLRFVVKNELLFNKKISLLKLFTLENRKLLNQPCSDIAFECDSNLVCFGTTGSKTCS